MQYIPEPSYAKKSVAADAAQALGNNFFTDAGPNPYERHAMNSSSSSSDAAMASFATLKSAVSGLSTALAEGKRTAAAIAKNIQGRQQPRDVRPLESNNMSDVRRSRGNHHSQQHEYYYSSQQYQQQQQQHASCDLNSFQNVFSFVADVASGVAGQVEQHVKRGVHSVAKEALRMTSSPKRERFSFRHDEVHFGGSSHHNNGFGDSSRYDGGSRSAHRVRRHDVERSSSCEHFYSAKNHVAPTTYGSRGDHQPSYSSSLGGSSRSPFSTGFSIDSADRQYSYADYHHPHVQKLETSDDEEIEFCAQDEEYITPNQQSVVIDSSPARSLAHKTMPPAERPTLSAADDTHEASSPIRQQMYAGAMISGGRQTAFNSSLFESKTYSYDELRQSFASSNSTHANSNADSSQGHDSNLENSPGKTFPSPDSRRRDDVSLDIVDGPHREVTVMPADILPELEILEDASDESSSPSVRGGYVSSSSSSSLSPSSASSSSPRCRQNRFTALSEGGGTSLVSAVNTTAKATKLPARVTSYVPEPLPNIPALPLPQFTTTTITTPRQPSSSTLRTPRQVGLGLPTVRSFTVSSQVGFENSCTRHCGQCNGFFFSRCPRCRVGPAVPTASPHETISRMQTPLSSARDVALPR